MRGENFLARISRDFNCVRLGFHMYPRIAFFLTNGARASDLNLALPRDDVRARVRVPSLQEFPRATSIPQYKLWTIDSFPPRNGPKRACLLLNAQLPILLHDGFHLHSCLEALRLY